MLPIWTFSHTVYNRKNKAYVYAPLCHVIVLGSISNLTNLLISSSVKSAGLVLSIPNLCWERNSTAVLTCIACIYSICSHKQSEVKFVTLYGNSPTCNLSICILENSHFPFFFGTSLPQSAVSDWVNSWNLLASIWNKSKSIYFISPYWHLGTSSHVVGISEVVTIYAMHKFDAINFTCAASRLFAAVIACMSPVKWRLNSSIGITWEYPPPAAPPIGEQIIQINKMFF